jgi:hypothetical protein
MLVRTAHCFQLLVDSMLANHLLICGLLASTRVCHWLVLLLRGQTRLTKKPPVKGTLALRKLCSLLPPKLYCALGATGAFGGIGLSPAQTTTNGCSTTNGIQLKKGSHVASHALSATNHSNQGTAFHLCPGLVEPLWPEAHGQSALASGSRNSC